MKTRISRDLQIGFGLSLLLVIISSIASYISIHHLLSNARKVDKSNNVIWKLESVISSMKDAETGQRGFLLTGQEIFLQPYNGTDINVFNTIKEVSELISDDNIRQNDIDHLKIVVTRRFGQLKNLIDAKRAGKVITVEQLKQGKAEMDALRRLVSNMENQEKAFLTASTVTQRSLTAFTPLIIISAAILSLLISVVYYSKLRRKYRENIKLRQDLELKEETISKRLHIVQQIAGKISDGDYQSRINDEEKDSLGGVSLSLNKMAESLSYAFGNLEENEKLQLGITELNDRMLGQKGLPVLTAHILEFLVQYTKSNVGAFYLLVHNSLQLQSGYALAAKHPKEIKVGEGLSGQCAISKKTIRIKNIDKNSIAISYASGEIKPADIIAVPVCYQERVLGVVEIASTQVYHDLCIRFLERVITNIGIALHTAQSHEKLQQLLKTTQLQAEELSNRQHELENMNAELEAYTQKLQLSDEELRTQQEELEQSNQILEERSHLLEERNQMIVERNQEIQFKAKELETTMQYKTEFMANMSHELRTPLNSILLLSRYLSENDDGNLSEEQIESAQVILKSGKGLLTLIDEILDLSKIEAGKMDADYEQFTIAEIVSEMQGLFIPVAKEKKLILNISASTDLPEFIETDKPKLEQILKNLLSNALKFTAQGEVSLKIEADGREDFIRFAVIDSGIGISKKDQELVFEPFRQADGSTRRNYGGTGLGLSISRKLAELLNGEIRLESEPGKGSTFILSIPKAKPAASTYQKEVFEAPLFQQKPSIKEVHPTENNRIKHLSAWIPAEIKDDRLGLKDADKVILIIEDDTVFANALLKFTREKGYKGIVAVRGDQGLEMVHQYKPDAVLLDIQLPVKDGWEVMEELKSSPATRHIPVHIMSSLEVKKESLLKGAIDFINKPLAVEQMKTLFEKLEDAMRRSPKKVLIVEDNEQHAKALSYFLETFGITSEICANVNQSINSLQKREADCVIMEMGISGKAIYDSLEIITQQPDLNRVPIIVFTGKHLSTAEENRILRFADSIVVKTAQSYQHVLDEVALFLHVMERKEVVSASNTLSKKPGALTEILKNKTILIADDDVRNIFSLSKSFEKYKMNVVTAINGKEALEKLERQHIDIVLMDMMMPEMDGYESTRQIRQHPKFKHLPVIAVTAKVMAADREACIKAGASDYISKPVDMDQLISLLRVWLYDQSL